MMTRGYKQLIQIKPTVSSVFLLLFFPVFFLANSIKTEPASGIDKPAAIEGTIYITDATIVSGIENIHNAKVVRYEDTVTPDKSNKSISRPLKTVRIAVKSKTASSGTKTLAPSPTAPKISCAESDTFFTKQFSEAAKYNRTENSFLFCFTNPPLDPLLVSLQHTKTSLFFLKVSIERLEESSIRIRAPGHRISS